MPKPQDMTDEQLEHRIARTRRQLAVKRAIGSLGGEANLHEVEAMLDMTKPQLRTALTELQRLEVIRFNVNTESYELVDRTWSPYR